MKTTIKRFAADINKVLEQNSEANYYNGLFDGGEWSQCAPDFSQLIERWSISRKTVENFADTAFKYAQVFDSHFPVDSKFYKKYAFSPDDYNPWRQISIALECVLMDNTCWMEKFQCPTCGRMTSDRNGSGVCNDCDTSDIWIDPAGGVHYGNEDDPAKMYE